MNCTIEAKLESGPQVGEWRCCLLDLPGAEAFETLDEAGCRVPFECNGSILQSPTGAALARIRVRMTTELVAATSLEEAKLGFERTKLASDDKAGRRTLWISLASAVISAVATITVALIARPGQSSAITPPTYRELAECEQSLDRLAVLSELATQTLGDLRAAIQHHEDACRDSLKAAVESAPN